jgi:hypothetical protein
MARDVRAHQGPDCPQHALARARSRAARSARARRCCRGIAVCGRCGRKLKAHYPCRRSHHSPAYHCTASPLVEGCGRWCLRNRRHRIDAAIADALLVRLTPAGGVPRAARRRGARGPPRRRARQWRLQIERARYEAGRRSGTTVKSSPSTASSPGGSSASGSRTCPRSPPLRPSSSCASASAPASSPPPNASGCVGL